eukprot:TRINITY_DN32189_c0_g1_i1.p1 TRINITY_DN32189_c0_g1~~TRINITY_DN32189_c0_g1_i1.p1  ORF type:complete len:206 (-),score=71.36 TRINITY_DN32189_c0_g1_i1:91-708(-)
MLSEVLCLLFFFFKQKTAYEMLRSLVGSEMCIRDRDGGDVSRRESLREIAEQIERDEEEARRRQEEQLRGVRQSSMLVDDEDGYDGDEDSRGSSLSDFEVQYGVVPSTVPGDDEDIEEEVDVIVYTPYHRSSSTTNNTISTGNTTTNNHTTTTANPDAIIPTSTFGFRRDAVPTRRRPDEAHEESGANHHPVSYTHLTLPTKRIV